MLNNSFLNFFGGRCLNTQSLIKKKFVAFTYNFPGTDLNNVMVNMNKEEERSIEQNNLEY